MLGGKAPTQHPNWLTKQEQGSDQQPAPAVGRDPGGQDKRGGRIMGLWSLRFSEEWKVLPPGDEGIRPRLGHRRARQTQSPRQDSRDYLGHQFILFFNPGMIY